MFWEFILKLWIVQDPLGVPCPSFSSGRNSNNPTQLRHLFFHRGSHVCLSIRGGACLCGVCVRVCVCLRDLRLNRCLCLWRVFASVPLRGRVWYVCVCVCACVGISQAEEGSGGGLEWNLQLYRGNTVTERGWGRRWGQTDRWTDSQEGFYQHRGATERQKEKRCAVPVGSLEKVWRERKVP